MQVVYVNMKLHFSIDREVSGSDALPPRICVYPPRWSASTTVRRRRTLYGVINNVGRRRSLLITRPTSALRICDNGASHAHFAIAEPIATMRVYKTMHVAVVAGSDANADTLSALFIQQ